MRHKNVLRKMAAGLPQSSYWSKHAKVTKVFASCKRANTKIESSTGAVGEMINEKMKWRNHKADEADLGKLPTEYDKINKLGFYSNLDFYSDIITAVRRLVNFTYLSI
jgi:hypothetical protein